MGEITFAPVFDFRTPKGREELGNWRSRFRETKQKLVFTNGVFDLLHAGHVSYLREARNTGDALILGLNSDASVRRIKGPKRPLQTEQDRALILSGLRIIDAVAIFDEETPLELIKFVLPDIMIKGADYTRDTIVGADVVEAHGGQVLTIPLAEGRSTSGIVERILEVYRS